MGFYWVIWLKRWIMGVNQSKRKRRDKCLLALTAFNNKISDSLYRCFDFIRYLCTC